MNKKNIFGIGVLTLALAGSLTLFSSRKVEEAKADEISSSTITDDEYEVAFLEQYMTSSSLSSYSYQDDKPLGGNNALPGHLYGNGVTKPTNYVGNLNSGVNTSLNWDITFGRINGKSGPNRAYFHLESREDVNIKDATTYPEATKPDEYQIGHLFGSDYLHVSAMFTTTAIKNIQDISIFWRSSYTKRAYICYKLDGENSWKRYVDIARYDADDGAGNKAGDLKGNYAGTKGWDAHGYLTSLSSSWNGHELYGKTAKIAIACTEKTTKNGAVTEEGNFPISAIIINQNKAAVRYLNTLTYMDDICSDNGENKYYDLNKGQSENVHNQDLFQLATERAEASFLANYLCTGSKTSAYYILDLYNHLVTKVPGLGSIKAASSRYVVSNTNKTNNVAIIVVSSVVAISAVSILCFIKKRKHN